MGILCILLIIAIILILSYFALSFYMNRPSVCQEDSLIKRIFIFAEKACKVSEIPEFATQCMAEIKNTKEGSSLLEKKDKDYVNHFAIFYFDGPKIVEKYKICRVCVGILCNKDTSTTEIEKELKVKGYESAVINFTKGVSRKIPNTKDDKYVPTGLSVYPSIENYIKNNSDTRESLLESLSYKNDEIEFAEIIDPSTILYYRPLFQAERFHISRLPPFKDEGVKKDQ